MNLEAVLWALVVTDIRKFTTSTLIGQKPTIYHAGYSVENLSILSFVLSLFYKSRISHFLSVYRSNFSHVLPISWGGYYASKLIESVVYSLTITCDI